MEIYAISVDSPENSRRLRRKLGAGYTFLSDPDGKVLDLFNIRHHQPNPGGKDIALPTMILTDKAGIIRWVHLADDYRVRTAPDRILELIDNETL